MNKDKSDLHSGIAVAIIFSIVAIIMSICSLARNNERVLGFDYLGVIVGILSLLVTILLGWNIFQLIDLKDMRKKDAREKLELAIFNENEEYIRSHHVAIIYNDIMRGIKSRQEDLKDIIEEFLFSAVSGIKYGIKINDIVKSNKHIKNMIYWLNQYREPTISVRNKSILLSDLNKLRDTKGLENLDTLINLVSNFPTNNP